MTLNRPDVIKLHLLQPDHAGIIVCSEDFERERLAMRINQGISQGETLKGQLIRVNHPPRVKFINRENRDRLIIAQREAKS